MFLSYPSNVPYMAITCPSHVTCMSITCTLIYWGNMQNFTICETFGLSRSHALPLGGYCFSSSACEKRTCMRGFHEHSTIATEGIKLERTHLPSPLPRTCALTKFCWRSWGPERRGKRAQNQIGSSGILFTVLLTLVIPTEAFAP